MINILTTIVLILNLKALNMCMTLFIYHQPKFNYIKSVPFDYFACYLLHIKDERPSIHKDYGSFVHSVLEHSKDEQTFIASFNHYLDHYNFSSKDRFFVENDYELIAESLPF